MSKDIVVLTPNGRRLKIHCNPDTSILQVLEDVCQKQGINASDYNLKHHNHILDLTITLRFSNLPNKAFLELVEADKKREETNVLIGLTLEDGERRTAEFSPNTSLFDIASLLAQKELNSLTNPTISYMRQEIIGISAMKDKTLRQLGLISGRAVLRLLNKSEERKQANVSAVYNTKPQTDIKKGDTNQNNLNLSKNQEIDSNVTLPTTSASQGQKPTDDKSKNTNYNSLNAIKNLKAAPHESRDYNAITIKDSEERQQEKSIPGQVSQTPTTSNYSSLHLTDNLERRLKIEEEVTFLGAQKAIAYMQPELNEEVLEDLPDDFYELTVEEVRKLYHELQDQRILMENSPLVTSSKREELQSASSQLKLMSYKNVVVRVQFPDRIILQGVFSPTNTIQDVMNFIKEHLHNEDRPFHIFTTPLKETLDPKLTLLEAKFVPCVHMHFKWNDDAADGPYLKRDIYERQTSCDAASILASKYRAPSRRKVENNERPQTSNAGGPSSNKVPKWFKS